MIVDPRCVPEQRHSSYPASFQAVVAGRIKKKLGDAAGLKNFGVNLTRLAPGSCSALRHWHSQQEEFIYILEGCATLVTNAGSTVLESGMAAGFPAGVEDGHHLVNQTQADVLYLEVGDRTGGDQVDYPDNDLRAIQVGHEWSFIHQDGSLYD